MRFALLALVAALVLGAPASAGVPSTVSFAARLVDDKSGDALTGSHHIAFELFDASTGGTSVWQEGEDVMLDDGVLFLDLGSIVPLDATVFGGKQLFLAVTLDANLMDPRIPIDSVPYSIRAGVANDSETVGGMAPTDLQHRITGTCGPGTFFMGVNADGTVACGAGATGTGDITDVIAGSGLEGGGTAGSVTLSLLSTCTPGEVLKWNGSAWGCANDADSGGDITSVTVGAAGGLSGGALTGDVQLSLLTTCGIGQLLKWGGASWGCASDIDTNSGGDITSVNVAAGSGLSGGGLTGDVSLSLLTTCAVGQLLKWNGASWACANDTDTNSGGDITDVVAGNGLTGGGSTGSVTLDIVVGAGLTIAADSVALDTAFTDGRYVNTAGDTMTGTLNMNGQRVTNRGCLVGYVSAGPGLCVEFHDVGGLNFTGAATRCRAAGTHLCSSGEMRSVMAAGIALGETTLDDWLDDQDADSSALFVNATADPSDIDGAAATSSSLFGRCCANVE